MSTPNRRRTPHPPARATLLPLGALAAGFGFTGHAFAQSVPSASRAPEAARQDTVLAPIEAHAAAQFDDKDHVQAVTTGVARGNQDIRDIPQSLSVVTEKLIADRKAETLNEALRYTAGVTFSAAENGTQPDTFIRGFSVAQVGDLMIDGMKDPSQYERDTFNLERVEVLRGSASMLFGRGSTGGVINQVSKKPELADLREVYATAGSGGLGRVTADVNVRTGEHAALRVDGMVTRAHDYGAKIDKAGLAPAFAFGIGQKQEFGASLFWLQHDNVPKNGVSYALLTQFPDAIDGNDFYGAASDRFDGRARYATLWHRARFDDGGEQYTRLRTGAFERTLWLSVARTPAGATQVDDATLLTRVGLTPRRDRYGGTHLQSDYTRTLEWRGMTHALLLGVDASRETADRFVSGNVGANFAKGTVAIGAPDDGYRAAVSPAWTPANDYASRNVGVLLQDLVEFVPHWKLLVGLRGDHFQGDYHTVVNGTVVTAAMGDTVASHRVGLLFQPTSQLSFHVSYGTSYNTSGDTYQFTSAAGGTASTAAQQASLARAANTPPEKSRNIEVGAKADWLQGRLSTRLAVFRTDKYNERTTDADFAGDAFLLSGRRHSAGWELEVAGKPHDRLEVYVSYAFVPTSLIDAAGSAAQNTVGQAFGLLPQKSGSAWIAWQATNRVRLAAGATGSSKNWSINGTTPTRGAMAPGYVVYDALAEVSVTRALKLQLNGSNLFNTVYGAELYRGHVILGAGRRVLLTAEYNF